MDPPTPGRLPSVWFSTVIAEGRYELLIEASDRDFAPGTANDGQRFTLTVSGNLPPRWISSPTLQVTAGAAYVYDAVAIDPNRGDALTYTLDADSIARGMTLTADGTLSWPAAETTASGIGRYPVTLRVVDPAGLFDEQPFAFVVTAGDSGVGQNNPPTITRSPAGQIVQDREFTFTLEATDPDGDPVRFTSDDLPAGAILTPAGVLSWTPRGRSNRRAVLHRPGHRRGRRQRSGHGHPDRPAGRPRRRPAVHHRSGPHRHRRTGLRL